MLKIDWNCNCVGLLHSPFLLQLILAFWCIIIQVLKLLCSVKDNWWGFSTRNAHRVHIVNYIRFKMVYTSWYKYLFVLHYSNQDTNRKSSFFYLLPSSWSDSTCLTMGSVISIRAGTGIIIFVFFVFQEVAGTTIFTNIWIQLTLIFNWKINDERYICI